MELKFSVLGRGTAPSSANRRPRTAAAAIKIFSAPAPPLRGIARLAGRKRFEAPFRNVFGNCARKNCQSRRLISCNWVRGGRRGSRTIDGHCLGRLEYREVDFPVCSFVAVEEELMTASGPPLREFDHSGATNAANAAARPPTLRPRPKQNGRGQLAGDSRFI